MDNFDVILLSILSFVQIHFSAIVKAGRCECAGHFVCSIV